MSQTGMDITCQPKYIIVAGASAGDIQARSDFIALLNEDMDAAVCIVIHLSNKSVRDFLVNRPQ